MKKYMMLFILDFIKAFVIVIFILSIGMSIASMAIFGVGHDIHLIDPYITNTVRAVFFTTAFILSLTYALSSTLMEVIDDKDSLNHPAPVQ